MIDQVRDYVKSLMQDGKIAAFLGLKNQDGNIFPHLFETPEELDAGFSIGDLNGPGDARYPMASILATVLGKYPDKVFGVLVRGCDDRALNELVRWNQMAAQDRVIRVGIACPQELARDHECRKPFPDEHVAGEKAEPVVAETVCRIMEKDLTQRLAYWMGEFNRCIKCYGCRNVCPVCFCNSCGIEDDTLIRTGDIPPENPMFHLVRAAHMAGRCIDCNLCTEACPAEIPLRTLYKKVGEVVREAFGCAMPSTEELSAVEGRIEEMVREELGYVPGEAGDGKSPLNILGPAPSHTSAND